MYASAEGSGLPSSEAWPTTWRAGGTTSQSRPAGRGARKAGGRLRRKPAVKEVVIFGGGGRARGSGGPFEGPAERADRRRLARRRTVGLIGEMGPRLGTAGYPAGPAPFTAAGDGPVQAIESHGSGLVTCETNRGGGVWLYRPVRSASRLRPGGRPSPIWGQRHTRDRQAALEGWAY